MKTHCTKARLKTSSLVAILITQMACAKTDSPSSTVTSLDQPALTLAFSVRSNCPDAVQTATIEVLFDTIVSPAPLTFEDFGFPAEKIRLGNHAEIRGEVDAIERTCINPPTVAHVTNQMDYTCYENSQELCKITFEKIGREDDGSHEH